MQLHPMIVAAAALGLAGFTDSNNKFSIDFPPGWSVPPPASNGSDSVQSSAPDGTGAFCRANSTELAALKANTQEALNASYSAPLDKATWASVFSVDAAEIQISEGKALVVDGRIVQFVTMTFTAKVMGQPMKARFASHILPGRMVNAGCFAPTESYDGGNATFENVVASLKPL